MPPRKPKTLRAIEGQRGHRTKAELARYDAAPQPRPITPDAPAYLHETGLAKWRELLPELEAMGTLTLVDRDVLGRHCVAYERFLRALEAMHGAALIVERGTGGQMLNPLLAEMTAADAILDRTGAQLGIGAAHRSKVSLPVAAEEEDDPTARAIAAAMRRS